MRKFSSKARAAQPVHFKKVLRKPSGLISTRLALALSLVLIAMGLNKAIDFTCRCGRRRFSMELCDLVVLQKRYKS